MRNIKKTVLLIMFCMFSFLASAQQYEGTMNVDGYKRDNVLVDVSSAQNGAVKILLHKVKFAMLMPVKVDVLISGVSKKGNKLSTNKQIPTVKGKPYEKYTVQQLEGTIDNNQLSFTCKMGKKDFVFKGKKKSR